MARAKPATLTNYNLTQRPHPLHSGGLFICIRRSLRTRGAGSTKLHGCSFEQHNVLPRRGEGQDGLNQSRHSN